MLRESLSAKRWVVEKETHWVQQLAVKTGSQKGRRSVLPSEKQRDLNLGSQMVQDLAAGLATRLEQQLGLPKEGPMGLETAAPKE
jgi:hypothetical protein